MIRECIVTTVNRQGEAHIAPLGLIEDGEGWIIAPFHPSTTLDNLRAVPFAVANYTDDVRIFAGCLTGRRSWPIVRCEDFAVPRLAAALSHAELSVQRVEEDALRPRFHCTITRLQIHAPFGGLNRAKAAVLEAAILLSRRHLLAPEKITAELGYLKIAIEKTAGAPEREAWDWLMAEFESTLRP